MNKHFKSIQQRENFQSEDGFVIYMLGLVTVLFCLLLICKASQKELIKEVGKFCFECASWLERLIKYEQGLYKFRWVI